MRGEKPVAFDDCQGGYYRVLPAGYVCASDERDHRHEAPDPPRAHEAAGPLEADAVPVRVRAGHRAELLPRAHEEGAVPVRDEPEGAPPELQEAQEEVGRDQGRRQRRAARRAGQRHRRAARPSRPSSPTTSSTAATATTRSPGFSRAAARSRTSRRFKVARLRGHHEPRRAPRRARAHRHVRGRGDRRFAHDHRRAPRADVEAQARARLDVPRRRHDQGLAAAARVRAQGPTRTSYDISRALAEEGGRRSRSTRRSSSRASRRRSASNAARRGQGRDAGSRTSDVAIAVKPSELPTLRDRRRRSGSTSRSSARSLVLYEGNEARLRDGGLDRARRARRSEEDALDRPRARSRSARST